MKAAVVIPTRNAGEKFELALQSIGSQNINLDQKLIIDSESDDSTVAIAKKYGWQVVNIKHSDFDHGKTRREAVERMFDADIIFFLTQDVILADKHSFSQLLTSFEDDDVAIAYGRQLPRSDADPISAHARFFNYPAQSNCKILADKQQYGLKTAFMSNSFAVYRRSALLSIGNFPFPCIMGEDMFAAAQCLLAGWKICYCAQAEAFHSHNYSLVQEFKRYFDIGVFQSQNQWIQATFGKAEGEGRKFVLSELQFLISQKQVYLIPEAILRTGIKYLGFRLGRVAAQLPSSIKRKLSMHSYYWR